MLVPAKAVIKNYTEISEVKNELTIKLVNSSAMIGTNQQKKKKKKIAYSKLTKRDTKAVTFRKTLTLATDSKRKAKQATKGKNDLPHKQ